MKEHHDGLKHKQSFVGPRGRKIRDKINSNLVFGQEAGWSTRLILILGEE